MNLNGTATSQPRSTLPAPLHTAADMPSHWDNVELDFDAAAQRIIEAHEKDGDAEDLPIADLKTWAVVPYEVVARDRLSLRDVHHEVDRLRYEAGLPPPMSVPVTSDARALAPVRTHLLASYDRLQKPKGDDDDDAG